MKENIKRHCDYEESLNNESHKLTMDDKKQIENAERGKAAAFDLDLALDEPGPMVSKALLDRISSIINEIGVDESLGAITEEYHQYDKRNRRGLHQGRDLGPEKSQKHIARRQIGPGFIPVRTGISKDIHVSE